MVQHKHAKYRLTTTPKFKFVVSHKYFIFQSFQSKMGSLLYPPLWPSCHRGLCFHCCTDVIRPEDGRSDRPTLHRRSDKQWNPSGLCRRWRCAGRTCELPPTTQCQLWSLILFYSRQTTDVCRDKKKKKKKAALLDGGHAEAKDDYTLLVLPAVIALHFSSTQRQGKKWLTTPITLMSPCPALWSS